MPCNKSAPRRTFLVIVSRCGGGDIMCYLRQVHSRGSVTPKEVGMVGIHLIANHQELVDHALSRISMIDLSAVRMKLADPDEGKGWDDEMLDSVEREYRRFLALNYAYPDRTIVPDKAVDEFWHQ